tara:strand:- start:650 stop:1810 length:1161 start_codon:yes stop_codon:yes gene_type:complete
MYKNNLLTLYDALSPSHSKFAYKILKIIKYAEAESEMEAGKGLETWDIPAEESVWSEEEIKLEPTEEEENREFLEFLLLAEITPGIKRIISESIIPNLYHRSRGSGPMIAEFYEEERPGLFLVRMQNYLEDMVVEYVWGPENPHYSDGVWGDYRPSANVMTIQMHAYLDAMNEGGYFYNSHNAVKNHIFNTVKHEIMHNYNSAAHWASPKWNLQGRRIYRDDISEYNDYFIRRIYDSKIAEFNYFVNKYRKYVLGVEQPLDDDGISNYDDDVKMIYLEFREDVHRYWEDRQHVWIDIEILRLHLKEKNSDISFGSEFDLNYICSLNADELASLSKELSGGDRYIYFVLGLNCDNIDAIKQFYEQIATSVYSDTTVDPTVTNEEMKA